MGTTTFSSTYCFLSEGADGASSSGASGALDLPRALEGGFGGGFFACFVLPDPTDGWSAEAVLTFTEVATRSEWRRRWTPPTPVASRRPRGVASNHI